jgi:hypothetical protein
MTALKQLYQELDALNATMNDETDDSPEILAEQERLFDAITAAEAADLPALSAKELLAHFNKRSAEALTAWKGSKAQLVRQDRGAAAARRADSRADARRQGSRVDRGRVGESKRQRWPRGPQSAPSSRQARALHLGRLRVAEMKRPILTTDNTSSIRIWDAEYGFVIEIKLEAAIAAARAAYLALKAAEYGEVKQ